MYWYNVWWVRLLGVISAEFDRKREVLPKVEKDKRLILDIVKDQGCDRNCTFLTYHP